MVRTEWNSISFAILGIGATGFSVAKFFDRQNIPFVFADTRSNPPLLEEAKQKYPKARFVLERFDGYFFESIETIVVSPGIHPDTPILKVAREKGIKLIGDVTIFFEHARAPIIAITGSNGKSTVTSLIGEMAKRSGKKVGIGGNLGPPMLDLLDKKTEIYVIELSSFQLELAEDCQGAVSAILNLSPDHLDRYESFEHYHLAKQRIFIGAVKAVVNRQDFKTYPSSKHNIAVTSFGVDLPEADDFGIYDQLDELWLVGSGKRLLRAQDLALMGKHNVQNALAALALGSCVGLPEDSMIETLREFRGLPHRCERVAYINRVLYIDDSKATNVGAVCAAISGFSMISKRNIILIAGGQSKHDDYGALLDPVRKSVKYCLLLGQASYELSKILGDVVPVRCMNTIEECVASAHAEAKPDDVVLLSPACASFDMFLDFADRGAQFQRAVREIHKQYSSQEAS